MHELVLGGGIGLDRVVLGGSGGGGAAVAVNPANVLNRIDVLASLLLLAPADDAE